MPTTLLTVHPIHATTSAYPGYSYTKALHRLKSSQEAFGGLSLAHVQLCPQSVSTVSVEEMELLQEYYPHTQFRLHANVRRPHSLSSNREDNIPVQVQPHGIEFFDASCDIRLDAWSGYIKEIRRVNDFLGSPTWSIHAGRRMAEEINDRSADIESMYDNLERIQDFMGCRVAVEGLYPSTRHDWLLNTFEEYENLLQRTAYFALDLSHINIIAHQDGALTDIEPHQSTAHNRSHNCPRHTRHQWVELITELLQHPRCVEVHLSDNTGQADTHMTIQTKLWWWDTFQAAALPPDCVVFSEGNQLQKLAPSRQRTPI